MEIAGKAAKVDLGLSCQLNGLSIM